MDNLSNASGNSEPSNTSLGLDAAGDIFNNMLSGEVAEEEKKPLEAETESEIEEELQEEEPELEGDEITVEVDGKKVTLTPKQVAEAYKNGLRQDDYTRKTMDVAEQRKANEVESYKASQEREELAGKLNAYNAQLEGALREQDNINWSELLDSDPVQYLKERQLYEQRQAALNNVRQDQSQLAEIHQQEQKANYKSYLDAQHLALLDKLPAWKDEAKRTSESGAIKTFLKSEGFNDQDISGVSDHRHVLLIRDAMKFRELLKSAPDAAKRVQTAPARAERSGTSDKPNLDGRTQAMKKFSKSGSVEDAGAIFASLL